MDDENQNTIIGGTPNTPSGVASTPQNTLGTPSSFGVAQNQPSPTVGQPTFAQPQPIVQPASIIAAPSPVPNQPTVTLPTATSATTSRSEASTGRSRVRRVLVWSGIGLVLLVVAIGLYSFIASRISNQSPTTNNNLSGLYSTQTLPLSSLDLGAQNLLGTNPTMIINGSLKVNNGFVITPTATPTNATAGQLYYNQSSNQLAYYNGSQFVSLTGSGPVVQSIGGLNGQITLGGGLSVVNNQLTAVNSGVLSFAGQNGNIAIGGGLSMSGTTLQNTGVISVAAATPNVEITNDGKGNISIGLTSGNVSSSGATNGFIPVFSNNGSTIGNSLISQSGTSVTITGDLNVVTGGLSLGNPLTVSNGGTGTISLAANGVLVGNGTAAVSSVTASSAGLCLVSTLGAPTFGSCSGAGGGVSTLNGLNGALSIANASGAGNTITIDNASTTTKGIAQFNSTDFSVSAGVVSTVQDINTAAAVNFGTLGLSSSQATNPMLVVNNTNVSATGNLLDLQHNGVSQFAVSPAGVVTTTGTINGQTIGSAASFSGTLGVSSNVTVGGTLAANGGIINSTGALSITPSGTLTLGSSAQTLALQGGSGSSFVVTSGANSTTLNFQAPTAAVTYRIPTAAAGTYDLCTTAGNCSGVGGGVTTSGGTTNKLAKFTGSQGIGDSSITDNGTTVTTTANLVVQGGTATIGVANSQAGTLNLAYGAGAFTGSLVLGTLTGSQTYTLPNASGTVCLSSGNCLGGPAGGANTSLSNLSSVAINTSLLPGATTIDLGSATAPFRNLYIAGSSLTPGTNNFEITGTATAARTITLPDASGTVCLAGTSACGFATGSGAAFVQGGNTLGGVATLGTNDNFGLNIRTNGVTALGLAANGNATFSGNLTVNGSSLTTGGAFSITPSGLLTVGSSSQTLALQGGASSSIAITSGANTTTLNFQAPGASVTYRLATAAAGSYDICTTANNCSGLGGSVSTSGGTLNKLAKFTGSQVIGDSSITDNGTSVTTTGNLVVQGGVATIGVANSQNGSIILGYGGGNFIGNIVLGTLTSNQTYTLPNASGQICLDSGNCLGGPAGGANSSLSNLASVAINTSLLPGSTTIDLGSATAPFRNVYLAGSSVTPGTNNFEITGTSTSGTRTITLPDASGTVCLQNSASCGFATSSGSSSYIQNSTTLQTANFNIQSASTSSIGAIVRAATGQTADVFQIQASGGGSLFKVAGNANLAVFTDNVEIDGQDATPAALVVKTSTLGGGTVGIDLQQSNGTSAVRLTNDGGIYLGNSTVGFGGSVNIEDNGHFGHIQGLSALTADHSYYLPNATGTLCLDSNNCNYINLQSSTPGSAQTGNINVSGTIIAGTALQAQSIDTSSNLIALTVGGTNANGTTVGRVGAALTLQGNASTTLVAASGANTTTVSFQAPTAAVTYRFATSTAGSYDVCTTAGNCTGLGGTVTASGATSGTIPVFTGSQTISNSLLSQSGSTVTANGNFNLTTGNQYQIAGTQISSANLSNDSNLAKLSASETFTGNAIAFKNALDSTNAFAIQKAAGNAVLSVDTSGGQTILGTSSLVDGKLVFHNVNNANTTTIIPGNPSGNYTITLPNAGGVICTDSGNCAGVGATLQTAYNFSAGGTTPKIKVTSSLLGVDIQDADTSINADLFDVRASNAGLGGLGSVMFGIGSTGQIKLQNAANSTTAFQILTQGGTKVAVVDTSNGQLQLGQGGTLNGGLVFNNATNAFAVTLSAPNTTTASKTITLPDASGTVCLQNSTACGFAISSGSTAYIQNGTSLQTSANFNIDGTGKAASFQSNNVVIKPTSDVITSPSLQIQSSTGNNVLTVAASSTATLLGFNLGSSTLPSMATSGIELQGALKLDGGAGFDDNFITPGSAGDGSNGASIGTKINIPLYNPGAYGQLVAMGLPSSAPTTARALSLFDARTVAHQPTLSVFSPNENNVFGLSWDGSSANAYLESTGGTDIYIQPNNTPVADFNVSAVNLYQNTMVTTNKSFSAYGNSLFKPATDSSTAFQIQNSGGTALFTGDTLNGRVAINGPLQLSDSASSRRFSAVTSATNRSLQLSANTIGNSSIGVTNDTGNVNMMSASLYSSGTGGTISSVYVYFPVVAASPNNHVKAAIYDATGTGGKPGALLSSATAPSTVVTAATWTSVSLGTTVTLSPSTNYWLVFNVDSSSTTYGYSNGTSGNSQYIAMTFSSNFPSSFGTPTANGSNEYSIYAPYQTITNSQTKSALAINDNNAITVAPQWDTDNAFSVQNASGTTLLDVNSLSGYLGVNQLLVNTSSTTARLNVGTGASSTAAQFIGAGSQTAPVVVLQAGATPTSTADLMQLQDTSGNVNAKFNNAGNQLTLGRIASSGTVTQGTLVLSDGTTSNFGATVKTTGTLSGNSTFQLSVASANGTYQICTTLSVCTGYASTGSGANTSLSNLSSVAINAALGFQSSSAANINFNGTATAGNALNITGQTGSAGNGGDVVITAGTGNGGGNSGGNAKLLGGNEVGFGINGGVTIDAGSGATSANGTINIGTGTNNATSINIGMTSASINQTLALQGNAINIGTSGSNAQTVTIGSNSSSSNAVSIESGTSGIQIGNNGNTAHTILIGSNDSGGTHAQVINIGANTGSSDTTTIQGGTGSAALSLQAGTAGTILIGTANANVVTIGNSGSTNTITLGQSTATNTIAIGNNTVATGNTQTINIGTSSTGTGKDVVTIGSNNGASGVTVQAGTAGIALNTNGSTAGTVVRSTTANSTAAFQIQDASASVLFNADTTTRILTSVDINTGTIGNNLFSDSFEEGSFGRWDIGSTIGGTSTATIDSTIKRNGNHSAKFAIGTGNDYYLAHINSTSGNIYARAYVYIPSYTGTSDINLFGVVTSGASYQSLEADVNASTHALEMWDGSFGAGSGSIRATTATVSAGAWHKIEIVGNTAVGGTLQMYLDGVAAPFASGAQTVGHTLPNFTQVRIGDDNGGGPSGNTFYVDDVSIDTVPTSSTNNGSAFVEDTLNVNGATSLSQTTIRPNSDTTTAFLVQNSSGNNLLNVDSYNGNITMLGATPAVGSWTTSSVTTPTKLYRASSVYDSGYIYYIGGYDGTNAVGTTYYAKVNADGSIGSFSTASGSFPSSALRSSGAAVAANGYIYYIGGYDNTNPTGTVFVARPNANGDIPASGTGAWTQIASLPGSAAAYRAGVSYANGYIYVVGGEDSTFTATNTVFYGKVNSDGTITWNTGTALPAKRALGVSFTANGYVYYMGGEDDTGAIVNTVYAATLNASTGAPGTFATTNMTALNTAVRDATFSIVNGYVYVMGGNTSAADPGSPQTIVQRSKLSVTNGANSAWTVQTGSIPNALYGASTVTVNGYVYYIGGTNNSTGTNASNYFNTVYYTSTSRILVGGSLDLVGATNSGTLTDPGDQSTGSVGGSLTAGNTNIVGTLQVQGTANFNQSVSIAGTLIVGGVFSADPALDKVTIGPSGGDTTGPILVLGARTTYTTGSQVGDPTGVAGAMYYNSSLGQFRCYEVDHWRDCIASARTSWHYTNEMITNINDSVSGPESSGTGAATNSTTGATRHPGIVTATTGTTTSGYAGIGSNDNGSAYLLGNGDYWRWEAETRISTLSNGTDTFVVRLGMYAPASTDGTNGCYMRYSSAANSGKWQGYCVNGGTASTCDTGIAVVAGTWYRTTVTANAAGTSVDFAINGVSKCQVTTNIPNTAGHETSWNAVINKTAGTTARTLDLDYVDIDAQFGSSR